MNTNTNTNANANTNNIGSGTQKESIVSAQTVILAVGYDTHRSGTPWMPIDRTAVTNGATILHSAELSSSTAAVTLSDNTTQQHPDSNTNTTGGTTYVVGGQKAAIEVLQSMDPNTTNVVWAVRNHGLFLKREVIDEALLTANEEGPMPWIVSRLLRLVPTLTYLGKFQAAETLIMALGMGVRVGESDLNRYNNAPSFRGGVVRQKDVDHALKFRQAVITNVDINSKGAVVLKRNRNDTNNTDTDDDTCDSDVVVGPKDRIIFCTGQRTRQTTNDFINMAVDHSTDGLFVALPYSSQACSAAAYTTKLVLDHLDDNGASDRTSTTPTNTNNNTYYSSGNFKASLEKLSAHVHQVSGGTNNDWAKVMVLLAGVGLQFPNNILPHVRGDLAMSHHWTAPQVLGKDLDARAKLKELAKPDYGGLYTMATLGATLLGFRFAKRRFLELPRFKK